MRKLLKNRNWTFFVVHCFTWKLVFVSNILSMIVCHVTRANGFIATSMSPITNLADSKWPYTYLRLQVMIAPSQLGYVTNITGFISTSINSLSTRLGKMVDEHALILLAFLETSTESTITNFTLQLIMTSLQVGVISSSQSLILTKFGRIEDHQALTSPYSSWWPHHNYVTF